MSIPGPLSFAAPVARLPYRVAEASPEPGFAPESLWLRPFGFEAEHLKVNFSQPLRPFLVTDILACCARNGDEGIDQSLLWQLTVGARIECLILILSCSGIDSFGVQFRCPSDGCDEESEVEVTVAELTEVQETAHGGDRLTVTSGGETLVLRRPTGIDQLAWLRSGIREDAGSMLAMARTLMVNGGPDGVAQKAAGDWIDLADEAMEDFDPLVNFNMLVRCPFCGEESRCEVDLEEISLRLLRKAQQRLLRTVHRLASHYHWGEEQIFAVPHWRRAEYLGLINSEIRKK